MTFTAIAFISPSPMPLSVARRRAKNDLNHWFVIAHSYEAVGALLAAAVIILLAGAATWFADSRFTFLQLALLLLASRSIRYIPAGDVTERIVCQVEQKSNPQEYPPLFKLIHATPAHIPICPDRDSSSSPASGEIIPRTKTVSYLSYGESLNVISSAVHVSVPSIISETNAYQHQRLSTALREYENSGDWNASTPIGQYFWYYPPVRH